MPALKPIATTSQALAATAVSMSAPPMQDNPRLTPAMVVRVYSDVNIHVRVGGGDATTGDMPVTDHLDGVLIHLDAGEELSVIKAAGEVNGTVWFTTIKRH